MRAADRAKFRATMRRLGPGVPARPQYTGFVLRNGSAAERAAAIAAADAARDALHRLPHSALASLGTSIRFRESLTPKLSDFADGKP